MLNKLQFNNLVISNKKGIQQSRIQTINKLVQKIRKLKTLLEKRPEDDKCKERIRKSTETMEILKKFKRVDIMKRVLLLEKPPAAVMTNGLSTPEEIAVALLAMNKVMQGLMKRFKNDLKLSDKADSKWREEMMESSKRKQKKERTEEKKLKRTTLKEQKAMDRKRKEWLEQHCENVDNSKEHVKTEVNISTTGPWKVEEIEVTKEMDEADEKKVIVKILPQEKKPQKEKDTEGNKRVVGKKFPQEKKQQQEKNTTKDNNKELPKKKQKLEKKLSQKIQKFEDNVSSEEEEQGVATKTIRFSPEKDEGSNDDETEVKTHIVDPFFVTDTGESYLSTAVVNRTQHLDNNDEDEGVQRDLHMVKLSGSKKHLNYRERNSQQNDRRQQQQQQTNDRGSWRQNQNQSYRSQQQNQGQWSNNNDKKPWPYNANRTERRAAEQRSNNWKKGSEKPGQKQDRFSNKIKANPDYVKTEEKLHPSWAAKQKQKPIITGFQGKKITFGDDGSTNEASQGSSINNAKSNRKEPKATPNTKPESLHPSWAAKQKLKPVITAFQGKKITFDNDD